MWSQFCFALFFWFECVLLVCFPKTHQSVMSWFVYIYQIVQKWWAIWPITLLVFDHFHLPLIKCKSVQLMCVKQKPSEVHLQHIMIVCLWSSRRRALICIKHADSVVEASSWDQEGSRKPQLVHTVQAVYPQNLKLKLIYSGPYRRGSNQVPCHLKKIFY